MMGSIFSSVYLDLVFLCLLDVYMSDVSFRAPRNHIYIFKMELLIYIYLLIFRKDILCIYIVFAQAWKGNFERKV